MVLGLRLVFVPVCSQGAGSDVHFCPLSLSKTYRWVKLNTHDTQELAQYGRNACAVRALVLYLPVLPLRVCHRPRTGLSP